MTDSEPPRERVQLKWTGPAIGILKALSFAMNDLLSLISHHGYLLLALICFAEAVGLPLPAALAILTAGSHLAKDSPEVVQL